MLLYLVRHAIAGVRDPNVWPIDGERPLTRAGTRRFCKAARGLRTLAPKVDFVLASPFVRAWDTALILQTETGWPAPIKCDELIDSAADSVLGALKGYAEARSLALVGHEPYLGRFLAALLAPMGGVTVEMKKGAVACIRLDHFGPVAGAELLWLLPPRALRALA